MKRHFIALVWLLLCPIAIAQSDSDEEKSDNYTWEDFLADYKTESPADGTAVLAMILKKANCQVNLMYETGSRHKADFQTPRIIVRCSGGLHFAFSTDPTDPKYEVVENIETRFDPADFRPHILNAVEKEKGKRFDDRASLNTCKGCHTSLHHVNWDSKPVWPLAYGSLWSAKIEREETEFEKLKQNAANNPRIALILPYIHNLQESNADFTEEANHFTGLVVKSKFHTELNPYRYAIQFAYADGCWNRMTLSDLFPPQFIEKHNEKIIEVLKERGRSVEFLEILKRNKTLEQKTLFEILFRDTSAAKKAYVEGKNKKIMEKFGLTRDQYLKGNPDATAYYDGRESFQRPLYSYLRYIFEGAGVPAGRIFPHKEHDSFTAGSTGIDFRMLSEEEKQALGSPTVFAQSPEKKNEVESAYCEKLKQASLKALEDHAEKQASLPRKQVDPNHVKLKN